MNFEGFSSPTTEMAEINRMQYEIDYTEGISQRMRVPEMLKVAPGNLGANLKAQQDMPIPGVVMEVPERIVVAGQSEESPFSRPSDLDFISGTNIGTLALKTPPRVLTLSERPLDFLDLEGLTPATPQSEEIRSSGHLKRDKFSSENALRQNGQLVRHDSIPTPCAPAVCLCPAPSPPAVGADLFSARGILSLFQTSTRRAYQQVLDVLDENRRSAMSTLDTTLDATADDLALADAASLRRQIIKLNRRLLLLEEENKERVKHEMTMYSIIIIFGLLNSWLWLRR
ncbi:mitochondrial fission factor homolog A isoform X2 [Xenopus laevis]|uniref:Mitochondrial fission factor n=1 Tax=Xenopus laevis TaxID=8355 RepID=A0A8J0VDT0_XENLA|nr:mitochondrial fission factor homolog A isoform X2 [Xenopus laevis]